jgi:hypothetical protein
MPHRTHYGGPAAAASDSDSQSASGPRLLFGSDCHGYGHGATVTLGTAAHPRRPLAAGGPRAASLRPSPRIRVNRRQPGGSESDNPS